MKILWILSESPPSAHWRPVLNRAEIWPDPSGYVSTIVCLFFRDTFLATLLLPFFSLMCMFTWVGVCLETRSHKPGVFLDCIPHSFIHLFLFVETGFSLCSLGCPRTQSVDQAVLKLVEICHCLSGAGTKGDQLFSFLLFYRFTKPEPH